MEINNHTKFMFSQSFKELEKVVTEINESKGWEINESLLPGKIALMHSELSEALEWLREENPKSDHIPEFTGVEEEFADLIIRVMHFSYYKKFRIAEAVCAKLEFNKTRSHRHGEKSF